jgi:GNAT superfamily N-acetyltransferase
VCLHYLGALRAFCSGPLQVAIFFRFFQLRNLCYDFTFAVCQKSAMENLTNLISLRPATPADEPRLHALIEASVRSLQRNDYRPEQINGALGTLLGLDTQLVVDGTYFVAEAKAACARIIVGCGGWSHRKTLFGSDHAPVRENDFLDPATDAARIRAFFIHPDWARRGIGTRILEACESAARSAGFSRFEMGATLTGVPLYLARGYHILERIEVPLSNGAALPIIRMAKSDAPSVPK